MWLTIKGAGGTGYIRELENMERRGWEAGWKNTN